MWLYVAQKTARVSFDSLLKTEKLFSLQQLLGVCVCTAETHRGSIMSGQEKTDSMCLGPVGTAAERELLCVLGTGDLGRSLGQRLIQAGYRVVYGSRRPHSCGPLPLGAQVRNARIHTLLWLISHI